MKSKSPLALLPVPLPVTSGSGNIGSLLICTYKGLSQDIETGCLELSS